LALPVPVQVKAAVAEITVFGEITPPGALVVSTRTTEEFPSCTGGVGVREGEGVGDGEGETVPVGEIETVAV